MPEVPPSPNPVPAPAEKPLLDLVNAQAARLDAQARETAVLWKEVKDIHQQIRANDQRAQESAHKYSQLRLEAWLGLAKVAIVVGAVTFVLWARWDPLSEVLRAISRPEPAPAVPAAKASEASPAAAPKTP